MLFYDTITNKYFKCSESEITEYITKVLTESENDESKYTIDYWEEISGLKELYKRMELIREMVFVFGFSYDDACLIIDRVKDAYQLK